MREGLLRQRKACRQRQRACVGLHFSEQGGVIGRVGDNRHTGVVLGRGTHHGRAADVDILDGVCQCHACLGDRRCKGVEIHAHQIDGGNVVLCQGGQVFRQVAAGEDAAMHLGVQGLDTPVEHFREAGVIADLRHCQTRIAQQPGRAAGGQQFHALCSQPLGKFENAPLVGDGDQCLLNFHGRRFLVKRQGRCYGLSLLARLRGKGEPAPPAALHVSR